MRVATQFVVVHRADKAFDLEKGVARGFARVRDLSCQVGPDACASRVVPGKVEIADALPAVETIAASAAIQAVIAETAEQPVVAGKAGEIVATREAGQDV